MLLVKSNNHEEFDLNSKTNNKNERFRIELMTNQLRWLTANKKVIYTKSRLLYNLYKDKSMEGVI